MDYLLKDKEDVSTSYPKTITLNLNIPCFERKSKKIIHGLPLWHINIGYGHTAKGIIAIGLLARGIISIGLLSLGPFSFGLFSLGIFTLGVIAIGVLSIGSISVGLIAFGAITIGIISIGALSMGNFSIGAMAIGKYFAMGDHARGMIAIGDTKAAGSIYEKLGKLTTQDITAIKELLDTNVPSYFLWAKNLIKLFLSAIG